MEPLSVPDFIHPHQPDLDRRASFRHARKTSMSDQTSTEEFLASFRANIKTTLLPKIEAALVEQSLAEEAMRQRHKGCNTSGMSWASSSFASSVRGDAFRFCMPTDLATAENVALVESAMSAAEEATGLSFDGSRVRGGSNYVVAGNLAPAPTFRP